MVNTELQWAAGLLEGEGSFRIYKRKKSFSYPACTASMTDEDVILKVQEVLGVGNIYGPYDHQERKPSYEFRVQRKSEAIEAMMTLFPYMGERRQGQINAVRREMGQEPLDAKADVSWSWLAGLLEGEGCFHLKMNRTQKFGIYRYPVVNLVMTDDDVVRRAAEVAGVGKIYGPLNPPSRRNFQSTTQWTIIKQKEAASFMESIYSMMCKRRRDQIDSVLQGWRENSRSWGTENGR